MTSGKLRVGVFMGGRSIEREVSFNSGRTICDHLDTQRYSIIPIFQTDQGTLYILPYHFLHRGKISDFFHRLDQEAEKVSWDGLKNVVDFIYLAVHGRYAEDGTIQGMLEVLGIPYLGTKVFGSALNMNKVMQKEVLRAKGIDVPRGLNLFPSDLVWLKKELSGDERKAKIDEILQQLSERGVKLPVVVKPGHEGSSFGISVVEDADQLLAATKKAAIVDGRQVQAVLIEEMLEGMEFVCVTLQRVTREVGELNSEWFSLPITEVVVEEGTKFFDYEQKYMPGRATKITPARCSKQHLDKIAETCKKATNLLDFTTISRIDGFLTEDGRVVIVDPNSLTGMSPSTFIFHQAAECGMSHTGLINFLIENELRNYGLIDFDASKDDSKGTLMATVQQSKIRVGVLLGGDSNEREISLESGRNVCYKLSPYKYEVIPVFVNDEMELFKISQKLLIKNSTRIIADLVTSEMRLQWSDLPSECDFVFIGLHGGKGEDGSVQGALEMLDLPYNGSGVLASSLCMDKFKTNNFLRSKGFGAPKSLLLSKEEWLALEVEQRPAFLKGLLESEALPFPLIVKPNNDGCSIMVSKVSDAQELVVQINSFFESNKTSVLIEEMIVGSELTCGVIGNDEITVFPPSMAVASCEILSIEEKFLPGAGENQTPAPLPVEALELIKRVVGDAYKAVGCKGYCRIDCFYQNGKQSPTGEQRVVILELNTLPGLTPATCLFHQAAEVGMRPMDLLDKIVEFGFQNHQKYKVSEQGVLFSEDSQNNEKLVGVGELVDKSSSRQPISMSAGSKLSEERERENQKQKDLVVKMF